VQPGPPGEGARAERAVTADEVEAVEVDVVQLQAPADVVPRADVARCMLRAAGQPETIKQVIGIAS